ncbi:MAG: aspartate aminotransferase family protein [Ruminococcus sp.]|jgi:acetylornithine/N-succinyldiaminopimelate aminotransferase|nr:aspartate aminotransferase family protein [Ruminococcus sp.]
MDTIDKYSEYIMDNYSRLPLVIENGKGSICTGENGRTYIDFGSGIGVNSLGYCDDDWYKAVCIQAGLLQHCSNYYYSKPQAQLSEYLTALTGMEKVFFCNSGAEANECAVKIARKYSYDKYGKGRGTVITLKNSFHGRTMSMLSATGQSEFHEFFEPFPTGYYYADPNSIEEFKAKCDDSVCAVMLEYIQGEGGVIPLEKSFVNEVYKLCHSKDILIIADEVQTGVGRTGRFTSSEHYEKSGSPDIITLAKGLAGGLPIGACLASKKVRKVLTAGTHGSTFGGNPVCCAAAVTVVKKLTEIGPAGAVLDTIETKGDKIRRALEKSQEVGEITGLGLMIGFTLNTKTAKEVVRDALNEGLLILTAKDKVRLLPPLNITYTDLERGMKMLLKVLD